MRRATIAAVLVVLALLCVSTPSRAQGADPKPATVTLKIDDKIVLATCKGLKVRITSNKDDFMGHSWFISQADMQAIAKKRKVVCVYDPAKKKLKLGTEVRDVIPPDPKGTDSFAFGKVRMITFQGKSWFDVMGLWSGYGFSSCSKMSYGATMAGPRKK